MAAKLEDFYQLAAKQWGMSGRMKLAMLTKISSEKARSAEDTPENIRLFEDALKQLRLQNP